MEGAWHNFVQRIAAQPIRIAVADIEESRDGVSPEESSMYRLLEARAGRSLLRVQEIVKLIVDRRRRRKARVAEAGRVRARGRGACLSERKEREGKAEDAAYDSKRWIRTELQQLPLALSRLLGPSARRTDSCNN